MPEKICEAETLKSRLASVNELLAVQGSRGNWNADDYMCGLYNGMELTIALLEGREPEFRTLRNERVLPIERPPQSLRKQIMGWLKCQPLR